MDTNRPRHITTKYTTPFFSDTHTTFTKVDHIALDRNAGFHIFQRIAFLIPI